MLNKQNIFRSSLLIFIVLFSFQAHAKWLDFLIGGGSYQLSNGFKEQFNPDGKSPFVPNIEFAGYGHASESTVMGLVIGYNAAEHAEAVPAGVDLTNRITQFSLLTSVGYSFGERYGSGFYINVEPGLSFSEIKTDLVVEDPNIPAQKEEFNGPMARIVMGVHIPFIDSDSAFNIRVHYSQSWLESHTLGTVMVMVGFGGGNPRGTSGYSSSY